MLSKVTDRREQEGLLRRVEDLKEDPEKQGKPLVGKLKGYRSLRALGQRYRIIYQVNEGRVTVVVVGVGRRREGSRKDIYLHSLGASSEGALAQAAIATGRVDSLTP